MHIMLIILEYIYRTTFASPSGTVHSISSWFTLALVLELPTAVTKVPWEYFEGFSGFISGWETGYPTVQLLLTSTTS